MIKSCAIVVQAFGCDSLQKWGKGTPRTQVIVATLVRRCTSRLILLQTLHYTLPLVFPRKCSVRWMKHTSALAGFRHVANRYVGEIGCCVKYLISPNPMPRLQPVIRTDFIPSQRICYRTHCLLKARPQITPKFMFMTFQHRLYIYIHFKLLTRSAP
jgi:hypothetical protein